MPADWRPPDSRPLASRPLQVPGTILEISYDAASRGADVQFLSCYPREQELLLPPFCMFSTHGAVQRGYKRFIRCSLTVNPSVMSLAIDNLTDVPQTVVGRGRRNTSEFHLESFVFHSRKEQARSRPSPHRSLSHLPVLCCPRSHTARTQETIETPSLIWRVLRCSRLDATARLP